MAGTSRYYKLDNQILVEYIYTDPANPEELSGNSYGVEILTNRYTSTNYMFSSASAPTDMGNLRGRSSVPVGDLTEYVHLNTNLPLKYNDYDDQLTSTSDLLQVFAPDVDITYDTIRIHLMSGFDFNDFEGYVMEIQATMIGLAKVNLSSLTYLKGDNFETLNPKPFMVADRLYSSYIELKIPALGYFVSDSRFVANNFISKLTRNNPLVTGGNATGKGIVPTSTIDITLRGIREVRKENGFSYFKLKEVNVVALNQTDNFNLLVARIQESTSGDYYEFYGEYNGVIFEDFMNTLNNQNNSTYIAFHEFSVKEQMLTTFVETTNQSIVQTGDWDQPMLYRPIIVNSSSAISYVITYTLRLINTYDNSQIIKQSQYTSTDVKKYGRRLPQINLGISPTVAKVYNYLNQPEPFTINVESENSQDPTKDKIVIKTEYVSTFIHNNNIKVSTAPIKVKKEKL